MSTGRLTLICGGGGAKGAAHAGAMRALLEAGLEPDRFLGTSMGSVFAALFAAGLTPAEVATRLEAISGEIVRSDPLALLKGLWARALLRPAPFRAALERLVPARRFDELRHPLTVTAVDIDSAELVTFGAGGRDIPLLDALYASCALPLFLPPLELEGRRYADGGLRAVVPLELALAWPTRGVVAVDVGPGFDEFAQASPPSALPPAIDIHSSATGILMAEQTAAALARWRADPARPPLVWVRPRTRRGSTFRVDQMRGYLEEGYAAARAALADLNSGRG